MDFLPLITIPVIFLFVVLTKHLIHGRISRRLCAICAAVLLTWAILLALLWTGSIHNTTPIAALMGMSVTGFMYKLEAYYRSRSLRHLWIARLVVVIGGFLTIMLLFTPNRQGVLLSGIGSVFLLVIITFLVQGTTHKDAVKSAHEGIKKSSLKKLDNCC